MLFRSVPLLRRSGARRTAGPTFLEGMAADWGRREDDDVPIAHLRCREARRGPSGIPEEQRDRPGGPSLEPVGGRLAPEREEARPGDRDGGGVPPATSTRVQEPLVVEGEPPGREEEPLGGGAAEPRVWTREEGRVPASFFYGSELAHRHLYEPVVMP